jgi:HPt (histidine-containing phosphotransfer) domain-containing protein
MEPISKPELNQAIDRLWLKFLPKIKERVALLESTLPAFAAQTITRHECEAASAAAHKLAGVLGTFSLTRGTVLARELEIVYSRQSEEDPELSKRVASIVAELRTIVETRE